MDLYFRDGTSIYFKTLPWVAVRLGLAVALGILATIYFGIIAAVIGVVALRGGSGIVSLVIGLVVLGVSLVVFWGLLKLLRKYVLYLVDAGHIATVAHIVDTGEAPSSQVRYGMSEVKENFVEASGLFVLDRIVAAIIKQFNDQVASLKQWVGDFSGDLQQIVGILQKGITLAASYIDEAVLAHVMLSDQENHWRAAKDGVVLYGKTWKSVLGSTVVIAVGMYLVTLLAALALTPVTTFLGSYLPSTIELLAWGMGAIAAAMLYWGVFNPWVQTIVITTFLEQSAELTPDDETEAYMREQAPDEFAKLDEKIEETELADDEPGAVDEIAAQSESGAGVSG